MAALNPERDPVYLDAGILEHPKLAQAGPLGALLYVGGLGYCVRNGTDGYVPSAIVPRLVDLDGIGVLQTVDRLTPTYEPALHRDLAAELVRVGLWELAPSGYLIHDFLDWNRSREELAALTDPDPKRRAGLMRSLTADRAPDGRYLEGETAPSTVAETSPANGGSPGEGGYETAGHNQQAVLADAHVLRVQGLGVASTPHTPAEEHEQPKPAGGISQEARKVLYGTLAGVQGSVPGRMTPREARQVGVALSEILGVASHLTPAEIERRAANHRHHFEGASVTAMSLSKWWSKCAQPPASARGPRDRAHEIWADVVERGGVDGQRPGQGGGGDSAGVLPAAGTPELHG